VKRSTSKHLLVAIEWITRQMARREHEEKEENLLKKIEENQEDS
jgi:hypothetical protein